MSNENFEAEFGEFTNLAEKIHSLLQGRDLPDQHPIEAITGLSEALQTDPNFKAEGKAADAQAVGKAINDIFTEMAAELVAIGDDDTLFEKFIPNVKGGKCINKEDGTELPANASVTDYIYVKGETRVSFANILCSGDASICAYTRGLEFIEAIVSDTDETTASVILPQNTAFIRVTSPLGTSPIVYTEAPGNAIYKNRPFGYFIPNEDPFDVISDMPGRTYYVGTPDKFSVGSEFPWDLDDDETYRIIKYTGLIFILAPESNEAYLGSYSDEGGVAWMDLSNGTLTSAEITQIVSGIV